VYGSPPLWVVGRLVGHPCTPNIVHEHGFSKQNLVKDEQRSVMNFGSTNEDIFVWKGN